MGALVNHYSTGGATFKQTLKSSDLLICKNVVTHQQHLVPLWLQCGNVVIQ